jgi:hypothetical protein
VTSILGCCCTDSEAEDAIGSLHDENVQKGILGKNNTIQASLSPVCTYTCMHVCMYVDMHVCRYYCMIKMLRQHVCMFFVVAESAVCMYMYVCFLLWQNPRDPNTSEQSACVTIPSNLL